MVNDSTTHLILWGAAAYVAYEIYQSYAGNAAPTVQSSATTGVASSSAGAGTMHMGNPGMISTSDLWRTGSGNGSGFAPLNIQPQYGSLATPTPAATPHTFTTWSMPGADNPDPSFIRPTNADVLRDNANINATMHAATVAEGGPGKLGFDAHCTSLWGNPIPGCK